ncbi:MAG TPA: histidinol dehydrogenase [Candidatus Koribacter sp.]|jgi:histidinol dehydrogenase
MRVLRLERSAKLIAEIANRGAADTARVEPAVRKIVGDVRRGGDKALRNYAAKFDGLAGKQELRVSADEMQAAWEACDGSFRLALKAAAKNIRQFCEWQMPKSWSRTVGGVKLGQLVRPLDSVGCYVPGGRYPLPSTMLMTAIPAQVAGVPRVVVVSPKPARETLAAAHFLGITEMYRIGGAQAVAALAYGTETIEGMAKIVGPGNIFVTTAKKLVAFDCGIDMLAGPTEALIVSDSGDARFIAADLVAQAEHDPGTLAILLTTSAKLATAVKKEAESQAKENAIARQALAKRGYIFVARDLGEMLVAANLLAVEHITVDEDMVDEIESAGSIFVGDWSAQSFGDYTSGPNHVLPTGGLARIRGGLSVMDYVKLITVQQVSREGLKNLAPATLRMAEAEGLVAHGKSVSVRCANA